MYDPVALLYAYASVAQGTSLASAQLLKLEPWLMSVEDDDVCEWCGEKMMG